MGNCETAFESFSWTHHLAISSDPVPDKVQVYLEDVWGTSSETLSWGWNEKWEGQDTLSPYPQLWTMTLNDGLLSFSSK